MSESLTNFISRGRAFEAGRIPPAKSRSLEEVNGCVGSIYDRLSKIEMKLTNLAHDVAQIRRDQERTAKAHNDLVKFHDENLRLIERENDHARDVIAKTGKELRTHIDAQHEDMRKGLHMTWDRGDKLFDDIYKLEQYVDFLLLKVAPEQLVFRGEVRESLKRKDTPKD